MFEEQTNILLSMKKDLKELEQKFIDHDKILDAQLAQKKYETQQKDDEIAELKTERDNLRDGYLKICMELGEILDMKEKRKKLQLK